MLLKWERNDFNALRAKALRAKVPKAQSPYGTKSFLYHFKAKHASATNPILFIKSP